MAEKSSFIPNAPVARILQDAGAKRVSEEAVNEFVDVLQGIAEQIATKAAELAKHSGRKTIQEGDIKLAAKNY
mgnify:CR=1 FL=1